MRTTTELPTVEQGTDSSGGRPPDVLAAALLRHLRTASWLDAQDFPALRWAVPGLVPEGLALLIGGPKIGKSWLANDIALGCASGGMALGSIVVGEPRPVLLMALEDGDRRLQARCRRLMAGEPLPPALAYMTRIEPGSVVQTIDAWLSTLRADSRPPLVILDTLGKVMPPAATGETTYQRDYRVAGRLKSICDDHPGMSLLALHHDRKAQTDDFVDMVSGTNGLAGAADTIVVLARPRTEDQALIKVTGREVTEREYAARFESGLWELLGDDLNAAAMAAETVRATANLADRSAEIVRHTAGHPDGVRAAEVALALGMEVEHTRVYLKRLADAGRLRKLGRGLYAPVMSVPSVRSTPTDITEITGGTSRGEKDCSRCGHPLDSLGHELNCGHADE
jgi:hypothetical protein